MPRPPAGDEEDRPLTAADLVRMKALLAPNLVACPACTTCPCCQGLHRVTPERAREAEREEGINPR